jgi:hypothetical protein
MSDSEFYSSPKERVKHELTLLIRSGYPYLFLVSYEDERIAKNILEIGQELKRQTFIWSSTTGLFQFGQPMPSLGQSQLLTQALADMDRYKGAALFVVLDAHAILESQELIRMLRNYADRFVQDSKAIIFLGTQEKIPFDLSREIPSFYFPLPDSNDLAVVLSEVAPQIPVAERPLLSQAALGLTLREATSSFTLNAM